MTAYEGDMAMAEDNIFQKLILIGLTTAVEDVAVVDAVHIMALALEERGIDSYVMSYFPCVVYLNENHNKKL